MSIDATSDIRIQSISADGVRAILAGTPLESYADDVIRLANQYGLDANWALSYIKFESGYLTSAIASHANNPFDILCNRGLWGVVDCYEPGNGYSYSVFPSIGIGLEAGFRLFSTTYIAEGYDTWEKALDRALCGNLSCSQDPWVLNVLEQGQYNADTYPITTPPPVPLPQPTGSESTVIALFAGFALLAGAAGIAYKYLGPVQS